MRQGPSNHSTLESFINERQRQIPSLAARQWSVLGFSPVLITEHSPIARLVVAHHMRTQEPARAVIPRCDWPVLNRRRSHKAVNFLGRLVGSRARRLHFHPG